jgi:outer membrane protein assembly factor BamB
MYKLINVNNARQVPFATSDDLVTLWQMLDNKEFQYSTPVIVDDNGVVVAGHITAFEWAKLKDFKVVAQ